MHVLIFTNPKNREEMKQIEFNEANRSLAVVGKAPIPAYVEESVPQVVTCWKLSLWERLKLIFTGKVYTCTLARHDKVQITVLNINKKEIFPE